jgi:hypothetical protein
MLFLLPITNCIPLAQNDQSLSTIIKERVHLLAVNQNNLKALKTFIH